MSIENYWKNGTGIESNYMSVHLPSFKNSFCPLNDERLYFYLLGILPFDSAVPDTWGKCGDKDKLLI